MKFSLRHVYEYRPGDEIGPWIYDQYLFWCPGCENLHAVATNKAPGQKIPVWSVAGSGDNLSFSPSIKVTYRHPAGYTYENPAPLNYNGPYTEDVCHSFVKDGNIQFLGDCFHALKNQTVPLPDLPEWYAK